jgi:PKD repeat protein
MEYFIDTDPGFGNATAVSITPGSAVTAVINPDLSALGTGFHSMVVRVQDSYGNWSVSRVGSFYNTPSFSTDIEKVEYFVDTDPGFGQGMMVYNNQAGLMDSTISIDLSGLSNDQHILFMRTYDDNGRWSLTRLDTFCKSPQANFSVSSLCEGETVQFTDLSTGTTGTTTYSWDVDNDGVEDFSTNGNISYNYGTAGNYTANLVVYDNAVCADTFTLGLTVNPVDTTTETASVCQGDSYRGFSTAGTHYLTETASTGCDSVIEINLTVHFIDTVTETQSICEGENYRGFSETGMHYITETASTGCDSVVEIDLTVNPLPVVDLGNDTTITQSESIMLDAGAGYAYYSWNVGDIGRNLEIDGATLSLGEHEYSVTVYDANTCEGSDTVVVTITLSTLVQAAEKTREIKVYPIPASDYLVVEGEGLEPGKISIINEAGQKILSTHIEGLQNTIDVSSIVPGIYFLEIAIRNQSIKHKIIIE